MKLDNIKDVAHSLFEHYENNSNNCVFLCYTTSTSDVMCITVIINILFLNSCITLHAIRQSHTPNIY